MEIEVISGSQANLVEDEKPFISPIACQGGFVIIYARAKAGKTFMALHTALAMAYGKDPIPGHWINAMRKPALVLYVSGEMTKAKFKKRKLREEASMNPSHELLDNIQFIHERTWRIDDPDAQKKYDRVIAKYMPDMIVLDNWQTLSTGSTARNAFDTFWRWISKWWDATVCWIMAESLLSQNPRLIFFDDNSKIDLLVRQVMGWSLRPVCVLHYRGYGCVPLD